jgi:hypothetical protein
MDEPTTPTPNDANLPISPEERELVREVLSEEYRLLASALSAAWSASLVRTSILLGVLSAAVVALGLVAQTESFTQFALVILPLALFLGLATFERVVEIQREATIYITGMNRIRFFFQTAVPASRPYFILPAHDDDLGLYRSQGTGMHRRAPRFGVALALVQTQGIVGVVCAVLAATIAGLAGEGAGPAVAWSVAAATFAITLAALIVYWRRSFDALRKAIRPINPTPPDEIEAAF